MKPAQDPPASASPALTAVRLAAASSPIAVWDREAAAYDASRQNDPVYASCVRQVTRPVPAGTRRCLDAGCGTGLTTVILAGGCELVVAMDYSMEMLRRVRERGLPNVLLVQADLQALPFAAGAFDACVCANALNQLKPDGPQQLAAAELDRVTRPGGTLAVSAHHYSRDKRRAGWPKHGKPGGTDIDYVYRFSRADLAALVPGAAIRAVGFRGWSRLPWAGRRLQDLLARLAGWLAARLGYGHMLLAVRPVRPARRAGAAGPVCAAGPARVADPARAVMGQTARLLGAGRA